MRRVSTKPMSSKKAIVFLRSATRIIVCRYSMGTSSGGALRAWSIQALAGVGSLDHAGAAKPMNLPQVLLRGDVQEPDSGGHGGPFGAVELAHEEDSISILSLVGADARTPVRER